MKVSVPTRPLASGASAPGICVYVVLAHRIGAIRVTMDVRFADALAGTEHGDTVWFHWQPLCWNKQYGNSISPLRHTSLVGSRESSEPGRLRRMSSGGNGKTNDRKGSSRVKCNLTLVTLTRQQIARAKEANGGRKQITHAVICRCVPSCIVMDVRDERIQLALRRFCAA